MWIMVLARVNFMYLLAMFIIFMGIIASLCMSSKYSCQQEIATFKLLEMFGISNVQPLLKL